MITYTPISIFDSSAQGITNPVNLQGVMGKGLAKEFKTRYPEYYKTYRYICNNKELYSFGIGKLYLSKYYTPWILTFPTKDQWLQPSKIDYLEEGLQSFIDNYRQWNITSISFPMLGCGNGGLSWIVVEEIMQNYLKYLPIDVYIHLNKKEWNALDEVVRERMIIQASHKPLL